jgi:hypothetical protein
MICSARCESIAPTSCMIRTLYHIDDRWYNPRLSIGELRITAIPSHYSIPVGAVNWERIFCEDFPTSPFYNSCRNAISRYSLHRRIAPL